MARHRRTLEDLLADAASQNRATAGLAFSTPAMSPVSLEHLDETLKADLETLDADMVIVKAAMAEMEANAPENTAALAELALQLEALEDALAANDAALLALDGELAATKSAVAEEMSVLSNTLSDNSIKMNALPGQIQTAIDDAMALPITSDRFTPNSLSIWPFTQNAIPKGAIPSGSLAPNSIFTDDIADFSLVARKFNDGRHRLY